MDQHGFTGAYNSVKRFAGGRPGPLCYDWQHYIALVQRKPGALRNGAPFAVKTPSSFDLPLIRTLGKAFYWQKMIDTGEVTNASELARRFKLEPGWVSEVLRMTRLAPDIIRAILEGRQPRHLNLHAVRGRQAEVALDWDAQRRLFEFIAPKG